MAFFLEATFVGLFFFGWDRLPKVGHLAATWLLALGTNLSALWILIANGWMQNPVGARFNLATMRMEVTDFSAVLFNPVAQAKFVHTVSAGYVTGSIMAGGLNANATDPAEILASLSTNVAAPGQTVTISGNGGFGSTAGQILFTAPSNQIVAATISSWTDTSIAVVVPSTAEASSWASTARNVRTAETISVSAAASRMSASWILGR